MVILCYKLNKNLKCKITSIGMIVTFFLNVFLWIKVEIPVNSNVLEAAEMNEGDQGKIL